MRLVYITLGWAIGVILAANTGLDSLTWLVLCVVMLIGVWVGRESRTYWILNIALFALALGGLRYSFVDTSSDVAQYNLSGGLTISGVIIDDPDIRDDRIQFRVRSETVTRIGQTVETDGLVLVRAPRTADVAYGDRVRVTGLLITPGEFDTFSYADFLARQGVYSIMTNAAIEVESSGHGSVFYSTIFDLRHQANTHINNAIPEPAAGLLSGILLGNERGISPELNEDFSRVGASHVIAISGFNMVIIAAVVMSLLNPGERKTWQAAVIGIIVIALYTIFVGANPAVIRAAAMSAVLIIGQVLKRNTYVPASLAFVALLMSIHDPNVLWSISFQLSFFATLGLSLFVDPLSLRFNALLFRVFPASFARTLSNTLSEPLLVTIAAQVFALPLVILYFERLSLVFLIVNVLIVPIQAPLLIFGGLATMLAFISPVLAQILYWIDYVLLMWTITIVRLFSELPFADTEFRVREQLIALYFVIVLGWSLMIATQPTWWQRIVQQVRRRAVLVTIFISGIALSILMVSVALSRPDGNLDVWFLDMGHSNAVLIETPNGAHILVDGGRFPSRLLTALGDRLPFTDQTLEVLVITQPDAFNYGALTAVVSRYEVGAVLRNGQPNLSESLLQLEAELADTQSVDVIAGYAVEIDDGVMLEVLHPQRQPAIVDGIDDHAVVLRLSYGDVSFLLTGDVNTEAQAAMLDAGIYPQATVMQLPQQATARSLSQAFYEAVQPQVVVVQIDPANRRGDPNPDVLARLDNTPIYRTDRQGTIHFTTDGRRLFVTTDSN